MCDGVLFKLQRRTPVPHEVSSRHQHRRSGKHTGDNSHFLRPRGGHIRPVRSEGPRHHGAWPCPGTGGERREGVQGLTRSSGLVVKLTLLCGSRMTLSISTGPGQGKAAPLHERRVLPASRVSWKPTIHVWTGHLSIQKCTNVAWPTRSHPSPRSPMGALACGGAHEGTGSFWPCGPSPCALGPIWP